MKMQQTSLKTTLDSHIMNSNEHLLEKFSNGQGSQERLNNSGVIAGPIQPNSAAHLEQFFAL